jgi:hypothetical protein
VSSLRATQASTRSARFGVSCPFFLSPSLLPSYYCCHRAQRRPDYYHHNAVRIKRVLLASMPCRGFLSSILCLLPSYSLRVSPGGRVRLLFSFFSPSYAQSRRMGAGSRASTGVWRRMGRGCAWAREVVRGAPWNHIPRMSSFCSNLLFTRKRNRARLRPVITKTRPSFIHSHEVWLAKK